MARGHCGGAGQGGMVGSFLHDCFLNWPVRLSGGLSWSGVWFLLWAFPSSVWCGKVHVHVSVEELQWTIGRMMSVQYITLYV